jgi:hypothetical protein
MGRARFNRFTRLGDHLARDLPGDIRRRAAQGDPDALAELPNIAAAATVDGLRKKVLAIISHHLQHADSASEEHGLSALPDPKGVALESLAEALLSWTKAQTVAHDTSGGQLIETVRQCAWLLARARAAQPEFLMGVVLGYGLAKTYAQAHREWIDGPALARERELAKGRAEGGRQKAENTQAALAPDRERARADFAARKGSGSASAWAARHAAEYSVAPRTLRRWLAGL